MVIRGENLMLFLQKDGGFKSIAYATNHSLNINLSSTETSNKDQGTGTWSTFEAGVLSWDVSSDNLFGTGTDMQGFGYSDLVDLMLNKNQIDVVFALEGDSTSFTVGSGKLDEVPEGGWKPKNEMPYYSGKAIITSISLNAPNGDNASYSVSLQGCGALKKKTA